jgi:hypothetical protein
MGVLDFYAIGYSFACVFFGLAMIIFGGTIHRFVGISFLAFVATHAALEINNSFIFK